MAAIEKSFASQKLTVDVALRLKNKVVVEETGEKSWDLASVWKVEMSEDGDPQFTFENQNPSSAGWSPTDGDAVAKQFLNLKSPQDALAFFRKYFLGKAKEPDKDEKIRIRWSEVKSIQESFLSALEHKSMPEHLQGFVFQSLTVVLQHEERMLRIKSEVKEPLVKFDAVSGVADCQDVLDALRAVVFLSRGSVWRRCANPKCEMFFKAERSNQLYHDPACTHRAMANRFSEKTRRGKKRRKR